MPPIITPNGHALGVHLAPPSPQTWSYAFTAAVAPPPDLDHRPRMRPVGNQLNLGSCTGWGGTAAVEFARGDGVQRSPLYVYWYDRRADGTAPSTDGGATMLALCKALQQAGAPPEEAWPYVPSQYSRQPPPEADQAAGLCRATSYRQVKGTGLTLLQGLWAALQQGPCPIALQVYESFEAAVGRDGKVPMPTSRERVLGGHCVCACGWFNDQSAPGGLGYVMCQNSWGEGQGDGGYYYLPAGYFTAGIVVEVWVLTVPAGTPPEPEPTVDVQMIEDTLTEAKRVVDDVRYNARTPSGVVGEEDWSRLGSVSDYIAQSLALLPKAPDVPPEPKPPDPEPVATLRGVYGTYAGHGLAQDLYGGRTEAEVQWGPHDGLPLVAPCRGHVELYSFGVGAPVTAAPNSPYMLRHADLFTGWTCGTPALYGLQTMYVAVFWPDEPLTIDGQRIGHLHYGHVRSDVRTGPVNAGDPFATSYDSGIRFENMGVPQARASHTHCCAGAGTALSPNGDLPGVLAAQAQGWALTDLRTVPGPTDYQGGRYCAGRLLSEFQQAGQPVPPLPH